MRGEGQVQASEEVKGGKEERSVLRDRDSAGYKARTWRKKGTSGRGDKVRRATTFGRFEDNLHYSRGKFLPWRVNGSLGPEIRIYHFLFLLFPAVPPPRRAASRWSERKRSENTNRRDYPLFCH